MARAQTKIIIAVDTSIAKNVKPRTDPNNPVDPKNPGLPEKGTVGVYMMDNRAGRGSTGEGGARLSTICPTGNYVSWEAVAINPDTEDSVRIQSFETLQGDVFGETGDPEPVDGFGQRVWLGRAANPGTQINQISLVVTKGGVPRPVSCYPVLTAN